MLTSNKLSKNDWITMICVWFAAFVSLLSESINSLAIYIILPGAFVVTFFEWRKIRVNRYFNLLVLLYLWILISVLWATETSVAFRQIRQCLGSFLLGYIFAVKSKNIKNLEWIYLTYVIVLIMDWYYAYNNIFTILEIGEERISDAMLNANTLAYHTFYATFAIYILGEITSGNRKLCYNVLFLLTIPLSFYTSLLTASRQVLIIQIPLIMVLLYIRYIKDKNIGRKFLAIFILVVILFSLIPFVSETYNNSVLKTRNELDLKEDSRTLLAKDAFRVGMEHFPFGVGPGNYLVHSYRKHFSHNTYLELFANEGIIGLIIYLTLIFGFVKKQWKRYRIYKDNTYLEFWIFGVLFIVDGVFYSFYEHLWLISFLIIVASHSETYHKERLLKL